MKSVFKILAATVLGLSFLGPATIRAEGFETGGGRQVVPQEGNCCLCTLTFDGSKFVWACNCDYGQGALSCEIDSAGCTNVGVCPD